MTDDFFVGIRIKAQFADVAQRADYSGPELAAIESLVKKHGGKLEPVFPAERHSNLSLELRSMLKASFDTEEKVRAVARVITYLHRNAVDGVFIPSTSWKSIARKMNG